MELHISDVENIVSEIVGKRKNLERDFYDVFR